MPFDMTPMEPADLRILRRAADLIEAGWTYFTEARDRHGNAVDIDSQNAVRFCAVGALERARLELNLPGFSMAECWLRLACKRMQYPTVYDKRIQCIEHWNDQFRRNRYVLLTFREAIAIAVKSGVTAPLPPLRETIAADKAEVDSALVIG